MPNPFNYKIIPDEKTGKTKLTLVDLKTIIETEKALNIDFEKDYKTYVTTYGAGILGGYFIRIYMPNRIQRDLQEWKERIEEFYFWKEEILTKAQVLEAIIIGDTLGGDEIIFYQNQYYVLPHNDKKVYDVGENLLEVINWLCSSGVLTEAFEERNFEPF